LQERNLGREVHVLGQLGDFRVKPQLIALALALACTAALVGYLVAALF
jgi:hypothetical protein